MSEKLTIKIDGKEFELVPHVMANGSNEWCYVLRPIKREPREKEHPLRIFLQACRVHGCHSEIRCAAHDARDWLDEQIKLGKVREVLE